MKTKLYELKPFLILWVTQSFSALGSAMTNFALVIWLYERSGLATTTALLTVCSYAPYVVLSIFAGVVSDRWDKKKIMLVCDSFAALCTVCVLVLLCTDSLSVWHLYVLNAFNGLMNSIQQPASDVAVTLLTPKKYYQKTSGMRSFSNSLVTILTPVLATSAVVLFGLEAVIFFDLFTFAVAFLSLLLWVQVPKAGEREKREEGLLRAAGKGLSYLKENKGILWLILFLAAINLIASVYSAALPAMLLSRENGGETVLGIVNACTGLATLAGSILVTLAPAPKNRVRVICNALLISMSTENFLLAFGKTPFVWCTGAFLGWFFIPLMNANMDVVFRTEIQPVKKGLSLRAAAPAYKRRVSFAVKGNTVVLFWHAGCFTGRPPVPLSCSGASWRLNGTNKPSSRLFVFFRLLRYIVRVDFDMNLVNTVFVYLVYCVGDAAVS